MRDRKEGKPAAAMVALLLVVVATILSACGSSGGDVKTSASTTPALVGTSTTSHPTKPTKQSRTTTKHATATKPRRSPRATQTVQWRHGHRAGLSTCAGVPRKDALARIVTLAKAAEKRHHDPVRAGMLARIAQLPEAAQHGKAAPAMAAALVAVALPVQQRAGAFAGCMAALRRKS